MRPLFVFLCSIFLFGCVEPPGGNSVVNKANEIGSTAETRFFGITCNRTNLTSCMLAAKRSCPEHFATRVIEEKSKGGFVDGAPAHLIEVVFICQRQS